ncbi:hypothetical protein TNCV_4941621 [Trichonephila clavipes]|nr:hypothetical protein TNCV_4941621 [Trichonephila clavipes]
MWGSSGINSRRVDLLNMVNDKGFVLLNDGSPTHYSHSYNSKEALDVTIVSLDLSPASNNVVHGCLSNPHVGPAIFSRAYSAQELDAAILGLNLNTSPGPDGIHGQMMVIWAHMGKTETFRALKRLLEAGSSSSRLEKSDCSTY